MTLGVLPILVNTSKNNIELSILGCYINLSSKIKKFVHALATFKQQIALCSAYQAKMIATETGSVSVGYKKKILLKKLIRSPEILSLN